MKGCGSVGWGWSWQPVEFVFKWVGGFGWIEKNGATSYYEFFVHVRHHEHEHNGLGFGGGGAV